MINELGGQVAPGTWESKVRFKDGKQIDELTIRVQTGKDTYEVYLLKLGVQNTTTDEFTGTIINQTGHPVINISRSTI